MVVSCNIKSLEAHPKIRQASWLDRAVGELWDLLETLTQLIKGEMLTINYVPLYDTNTCIHTQIVTHRATYIQKYVSTCM